MNTIIAFCGLDCGQCEAYLATQANDEAAKEQIAARWSEEFHAPGLTAAYVTCDGCIAFDGRLGGHCLECDIRACGEEKGVANCASCPEYACEKLQALFDMAPGARERLDALRTG